MSRVNTPVFLLIILYSLLAVSHAHKLPLKEYDDEYTDDYGGWDDDELTATTEEDYSYYNNPPNTNNPSTAKPTGTNAKLNSTTCDWRRLRHSITGFPSFTWNLLRQSNSRRNNLQSGGWGSGGSMGMGGMGGGGGYYPSMGGGSGWGQSGGNRFGFGNSWGRSTWGGSNNGYWSSGIYGNGMNGNYQNSGRNNNKITQGGCRMCGGFTLARAPKWNSMSCSKCG